MAALEKEREKLRQLQQLSERRRSILQEGNDTKTSSRPSMRALLTFTRLTWTS